MRNTYLVSFDPCMNTVGLWLNVIRDHVRKSILKQKRIPNIVKSAVWCALWGNPHKTIKWSYNVMDEGKKVCWGRRAVWDFNLLQFVSWMTHNPYDWMALHITVLNGHALLCCYSLCVFTLCACMKHTSANMCFLFFPVSSICLWYDLYAIKERP